MMIGEQAQDKRRPDEAGDGRKDTRSANHTWTHPDISEDLSSRQMETGAETLRNGCLAASWGSSRFIFPASLLHRSGAGYQMTRWTTRPTRSKKMGLHHRWEQDRHRGLGRAAGEKLRKAILNDVLVQLDLMKDQGRNFSRQHHPWMHDGGRPTAP